MILTDEVLTQALLDVQAQILLKLPVENEFHHIFSIRFERKMRKIIQQEKETPLQRKLSMYSKRAAVFFLVMVLAMFTTVMSVSALRTQFFHVITNIYQKYSEIYFQPSESQIASSSLFEQYAVCYFPKGYELVNRYTNENMKINNIEFKNSNNNRIEFYQEDVLTANFNVNTEGVNLQEIEVNGNRAYYYENKGMHTIVWHNDRYAFLLSADVTSTLDKNEMIKIAESVAVE